jgi:hypothetical protein
MLILSKEVESYGVLRTLQRWCHIMTESPAEGESLA